MKSRPEVSEEEIQQYMDFEKLLLEKDRYVKKQKMFRWGRNIGISAGVITLAALIYMLSTPVTQEIATENSDPSTGRETKQKISEETNGAPIDTAITQSAIGEKENINRSNSEQKSNAARVETDPDKDNQNLPVESGNSDQSHASPSVYHQAAPVNGYPDLYAYFERELTYPKEAVTDSLTGVVTVVFTINTEGMPENILVENSLGSVFDREVHRVIENMPPWNPASYNGRPMKSKVSIPLTFELKKTKFNE